LSRYDEIVKALTELKGEAKLEDIHKKILETVGINPPSKGTVGATLQNFQEPKEGKKYSFHRMGKGVWKLVDNEVKTKAKAKSKTKPVASTPIIGQRTTVAVEDLPSFIDQIIEPLKKDGGQMSITIEVLYRPELSE
jgi:hypothetical protein